MISKLYIAGTRMKVVNAQNQKSFIYKYAQIRAYILIGLLIFTFVLLAGLVYRNMSHFETVRSYVDYSHRILQVTLELQEALSNYLEASDSELDTNKVKQVSDELDFLARNQYHAQAETPEMLLKAKELIQNTSEKKQTALEKESTLLEALKLTGTMLDSETKEREKQLEEITNKLAQEIALAGVTVILVLILIIVFVQTRILVPLQDLRKLLLNLAWEDYTPIQTEHIDPLLQPIFSSYNEMVKHLAELEETKRHYAESLEQEVRAATRAIMEQQASLAQAERLAVAGELAANIAHELRNPLAGIQMCCSNIRSETHDQEQKERLDLVVSELKRMGRLLNELLERSKHEPVEICECNISNTIKELSKLTRYQISTKINLVVITEPNLFCRVPECRLKQTLLNMILNAANAVGNDEGVITIEAMRVDQHINISVFDTGPGFSKEFLNKDIRPFMTERSGGTGLGLAMVKRFVYDIGGKLYLNNMEPHGAKISITIPDNGMKA